MSGPSSRPCTSRPQCRTRNRAHTDLPAGSLNGLSRRSCVLLPDPRAVAIVDHAHFQLGTRRQICVGAPGRLQHQDDCKRPSRAAMSGRAEVGRIGGAWRDVDTYIAARPSAQDTPLPFAPLHAPLPLRVPWAHIHQSHQAPPRVVSRQNEARGERAARVGLQGSIPCVYAVDGVLMTPDAFSRRPLCGVHSCA